MSNVKPCYWCRNSLQEFGYCEQYCREYQEYLKSKIPTVSSNENFLDGIDNFGIKEMIVDALYEKILNDLYDECGFFGEEEEENFDL